MLVFKANDCFAHFPDGEDTEGALDKSVLALFREMAEVSLEAEEVNISLSEVGRAALPLCAEVTEGK